MERDQHAEFQRYPKYISTHTLTWSVTAEIADILKGEGSISTHTLTWSVTVTSDFPQNSSRFQLTRSRGA